MEKNYLIIRNVTKKIQNEVLLKEINLSLKKHHIYGIKGSNGSGKTLLFKIICGFTKPSSGSVVVNGQTIGEHISFPSQTGILIEHPGFLPDLTGFENLKSIAFLMNQVSDEVIQKSLMAVGLDPNLKKKFKKYSLGMKQRLGIAQAFLGNPELILLDEPTNALDEEGVKMLRDTVLKAKERGALVLLTSHHQSDLTYLCDKQFVLSEGRLIESEPIND